MNNFEFFIRITGAKGDRNIHASVSEQLKKNFAKSKWKVRYQSPEGNSSRNNFFILLSFFSWKVCCFRFLFFLLICGQVLTHVLSWELLTCTRAACFLMPVCQKASATEILTFYNYFNQSQNSRPVESLELLFDWLIFSSYWLTDLRTCAS